MLQNNSAFHAVTGINIFNDEPIIDSVLARDKPPDQFTLDRYSEQQFQGLMPDTGAAGISTAGIQQVKALSRLIPLTIDTSTAGDHVVRFGAGDAESIGTTTLDTPIGTITFVILPTATPFLISLADMDRLGIRFDNLQNIIIKSDGTKIPVARHFGHAWILWLNQQRAVVECHLTESQLRQLHRRFGHPTFKKLSELLDKANEEYDSRILKKINKFCHQCQMNSKGPGRFRFNIRDDMDFNAELIVDIMYLDGNRPVLHCVDNATAFQAARFLRSMESNVVWEALQLCWLNVYTGPPDVITTDAGTNFRAADFKNNASAMSITVKEVPVEAHNSIGKVERYHAPLRRAYDVIRADLPGETAELCLSLAVKAINDTVGPNGLVPTLLVFGAYPKLSKTSTPAPGIIARGIAVRKAMKELNQLRTQRQIDDALAMRNGPDVTTVLGLSPNDNVLVYREPQGWTGPFKLLAINDNTATVNMPYGPTQFRSTVVKAYHLEDADTEILAPPPALPDGSDNEVDDDYQPPPQASQSQGKRRGRPPGAKNKPRTPVTQPMSQPTAPDNARLQSRPFSPPPIIYDTFLTAKEEYDYNLALTLRQQNKITTPGAPFEASDKAEIQALIDNDVFRFEQYDPAVHKAQLFKSRLVREVKGKETSSPYEKSRLVIQGFNDNGKALILTQSPTIQRASQRLIMALAPALMSMTPTKNGPISLWLRDITQAYLQSSTKLNRTILAKLPTQLIDSYPKDTIMVVVKPLYGIAEAGTHWWATYSRHHKDKLAMVTSTYDPCLLITNSDPFGIVGMQTDDTVMLCDTAFNNKEQKEMIFKCKDKEELSIGGAIAFNGCIASRQDDNSIDIKQKAQGKKLLIINDADTPANVKQQFIEQRARGAYLASICQPEATFDLAIAAQSTEPSPDDIKALNKRIQWQIDNQSRGLHYVPLNLSALKCYVFVDGSFANNKDLSSQIGYVIVLGTEQVTGDNQFTLTGNVIHWSSTKCKRVTRSVLASEIYGMAHGVDIGFAITSTLNQILQQLDMPPVPLVVCTDSYSLYECIVKLGTTQEKRLMIDIMALREMYERRELVDMRWISGPSNPADAMTKGSPNKALQGLIDNNVIDITVEGWVKRPGETD